MRFLHSVNCRFGNSLSLNHSHLSGRPGGCHDPLLIAIGGMVALPIQEAVFIVTVTTDIYYGDLCIYFCTTYIADFLSHYQFPNMSVAANSI